MFFGEWEKLPQAARRYILMHCIISPVLFEWYIIPYLMIARNISVFEIGLIYTLSSAAGSILKAPIGRILDRKSPNIIIALDLMTEGLETLLYYLGLLYLRLDLLLIASIIGELSSAFYPAYSVYEYSAYPEDIREKAFLYHNLLPFTSSAIGYPILGYIVSRMEVNTLMHTLILFSAAFILLSATPLLWLPKIGERVVFEEEEGPISIPRRFIMVSLTAILFTFSLSLAPIFTLVNLFMKHIGGGLFEIGVYECIGSLTVIICTLALFKAKKKHGRRLVILSLALFGTAYMMLYLSNSVALAFLSSILFSVGNSIYIPFFRSILFSTIPEDIKGTLLGGLSAVNGLIGIACPAIAGYLAAIHAGLPYLTSSLLVFASIPLFIYSTRGYRPTD